LELILLPGLDGSGILFKDLIAALPATLTPHVICLDQVKGETYYEKASYLSQYIYGNEVIIVAESYSGRIAYELCGLLGCRVKRVIFLASFIHSPSHTSKLANLVPISMLNESYFSRYLLLLIGFAGCDASSQVKCVFKSISLADKEKLKNRLSNIATLDEPVRSFNTKTIYIQPTHDFLVNRRAVKKLQRLFKNTSVYKVKGGHFIAQTQPKQCAKVIENVIDEYEGEKK